MIFIHNPNSNHGAHVADIQALERTLGGRCPWWRTSAAGEAATLAREAALEGAEVVVAVGGDGTVHEIVNGLMTLPQVERPKLGILPVGSGNDFAFAAGIPTDLKKALEVVLRGETLAGDVGSIEIGTARSYWCNTVGIGFDAKVTVRSRRIRALRGTAMYVAATLLTLMKEHETFEAEITVDGESFHEPILMMTLGNGPREGGGFYTTPNSRIDDGQFEMLIGKPMSRLRMLSLLLRVLKGTHLGSPEFSLRSFHRMNLTSDRSLVIHADGEILAVPVDGVRSITVELQPVALRVIR